LGCANYQDHVAIKGERFESFRVAALLTVVLPLGKHDGYQNATVRCFTIAWRIVRPAATRYTDGMMQGFFRRLTTLNPSFVNSKEQNIMIFFFRRGNWWHAIWLAMLLFGTCSAEESRLAINEDNSHFFGTRSAEDMTLEGLHAFVDQYANTGVSHLFLCPNAMRASFRSKTRDAIWEVGDQEMPTGGGRRWMDNAKLLDERGLDPYQIWIARCRVQGISPWLSMRMNDLHSVDNVKNFMHSTFWLKHPEFWRVPGGNSWIDRALDYSVPEVREHNLAFVEELLERYDPDGIELDWMRFGYHFKPGLEDHGRAILTDFLRDVRQLADRYSVARHHPLKVGVRVPTHPDAAAGLGMDAVAWAREGLIDMLVVTPFWTTSDFDIPLELWRKQLGAANERVILAAGLEHNLRAFPGAPAVPNDLASTRGFMVSSLQRGAYQIYLFNFMDSETRPVSQLDYRQLIQDGSNWDAICRKPRRHVICFRDTVPPGFPNGAQLPVETVQPAEFELHTGPTVSEADIAVLIGLADRPGVMQSQFTMRLNDVPCETPSTVEQPSNIPPMRRVLRFPCPRHSLQPGRNHIALRQAAGQIPQRIEWVEVIITPLL
jgi:hypothetical protein